MVKGHQPPIGGWLGIYDEYAEIVVNIFLKHQIDLRPELRGITRHAVRRAFAVKKQGDDYNGDSCHIKNCPYGKDCTGEVKLQQFINKGIKPPNESLRKCRYTRKLQDRKNILDQIIKKAKRGLPFSDLLSECGKDGFLNEALKQAGITYNFLYTPKLPNNKDIVDCIEAAKKNLYCHSKGGSDLFSRSLTKAIMGIYEEATGAKAREGILHNRSPERYHGAFYSLIEDVFKALKEQPPHGRSIVRWIDE